MFAQLALQLTHAHPTASPIAYLATRCPSHVAQPPPPQNFPILVVPINSASFAAQSVEAASLRFSPFAKRFPPLYPFDSDSRTPISDILRLDFPRNGHPSQSATKSAERRKAAASQYPRSPFHSSLVLPTDIPMIPTIVALIAMRIRARPNSHMLRRQDSALIPEVAASAQERLQPLHKLADPHVMPSFQRLAAVVSLAFNLI